MGEAESTTDRWANSDLYGSWRITSSKGYIVDSDGKSNKAEKETTLDGVIIFTPDHRMIAFVVHPGRTAGASDEAKLKLFGSMVTYSGRFTLDPDKYIVTIDWSSSAGNQNEAQTRYYKIENDALQITVPEHRNISDPTKRNANVLNAVRER